MHVDAYEKIWMALSGVLIVLFLAVLAIGAGSHAVHPPSHVETVDPTTIYDNEEFGNPGVTTRADGRIVVSILAQMFIFEPDPIEIPAGVPVTFRLTSADVIHGFQVVGTNANAMVIPGYVSEFTMTFDTPGEHLILCHEYCGLLHHEMMSKLIVTDLSATEETP